MLYGVSFIIFGLLALALNAAADLTYMVVGSPPSRNNIFGVAIGDVVYPMQADPDVPMLYVGSGPRAREYRYVILDDASSRNIIDFEPFTRPGIKSADETYNEVYGRAWNKLHLPELPQVYSFFNKEDDRDPAASKLFEEGQIATLHIQADEDQIQEMHAAKLQKGERKGEKVPAKMTYIGYDSIKQFDNVQIKVGGHSSREWAKVPYKITIPESSAPNGLYRRWEIKLRPEATDPTMIREKLYNDMLQASGILAARGAYVRLYINDAPVGLFLLADDPSADSYIRETIHNGDQRATLGPLVKGDAGKGEYAANFGYRGDDVALYDKHTYEVKIEGDEPDGAMMSLIRFMKYIRDYDPSSAPNSPAALDMWTPKFDMVHYLRQLALEFITGNWDGVQYAGNNFVIYQHPDSKQYIMIPMDFDYTFGNGLEGDQGSLLTGSWRDFTKNRKIHSYLWEKIKATPFLSTLYESTLNTLMERLARPEILFERIDALAYMIERDVDWDRSLKRFTSGLERNWQAVDFRASLEQGTGEVDERLGLKEWIRGKYAAVMKQHRQQSEGGVDDDSDADDDEADYEADYVVAAATAAKAAAAAVPLKYRIE